MVALINAAGACLTCGAPAGAEHDVATHVEAEPLADPMAPRLNALGINCYSCRAYGRGMCHRHTAMAAVAAPEAPASGVQTRPVRLLTAPELTMLLLDLEERGIPTADTLFRSGLVFDERGLLRWALFLAAENVDDSLRSEELFGRAIKRLQELGFVVVRRARELAADVYAPARTRGAA